MTTEERLDLLGDAAQFDVSNPGVGFSDAVKQAEANLQKISGGIFYAQAAGGHCMPVFKVMLSNECRNDCAYCGCRSSANCRRSTFTPQELATSFIHLEQKGLVQGLFLSSGIRDDAERTQERMIDAVAILRYKYQYKGFIHLKLLPGISDAAVHAAARLANRLSLNLEAPTVQHLAEIAPDKVFRAELLGPLSLAAEIQKTGLIRSGLTTQFVVGGSTDTDSEILTSADWLYRKLHLRRSYYSPFHPLPNSPLENVPAAPMWRGPRLYQADALLREYKFSLDELAFSEGGLLSPFIDPKLAAALMRTDFFPLEVNCAGREELLRVPGIGPKSAERIIIARSQGAITSPQTLQMLGIKGDHPVEFLTFNGRYKGSGQLQLDFYA